MITWTSADVERFLAEDPGGPVVMLNLLRFHPDGGRETYMAYVAGFAPLNVRYGIEVVYGGDGGRALAGEPGQVWDTVALVRYPSRQVFGEMIRDPDYLAIEHLRTESLVEAVLQPTVPFMG
ncbi:MAG: hypothetical protein AVDCRST_MAG33-3006 [uncultured Thermomicrobiales bacterium]|uniref:Uncharacterized protein n=1 Tax=uncultured Thermomicrobiales bacterium TaxID=1645740 RepID=A0A6J4VCI1_9BACT|nr:MAG: hypothetical protein AVDCRST_MAG33-3006 [uncultured Thermomicrobiales bacterium]